MSDDHRNEKETELHGCSVNHLTTSYDHIARGAPYYTELFVDRPIATTGKLNVRSKASISFGLKADCWISSPSYRPRIESGVTDPGSSRKSPPQAAGKGSASVTERV